MAEKVVDVADFSMTPGGRYRSEGRWSGEEFRDDCLVPLLDAGEDVVVDLDRPIGFTSSFLEEVFGGLVRKYGTTVVKRVTIRAATRPARADRARALMDRAVNAAK